MVLMIDIVILVLLLNKRKLKWRHDIGEHCLLDSDLLTELRLPTFTCGQYLQKPKTKQKGILRAIISFTGPSSACLEGLPYHSSSSLPEQP